MKEIKLPKMIDYYRRKNNWTMKQLGEKMGKSESAVSRWIKGERSPMVDDLEKLAFSFGVSVEDLMFGEKNSVDINTIYNELNKERQTKVYNYASKQLEEQNSNVTSIDKNKKVYVLGKTAANPIEVSYGDAVYDETIDTNVPRNADCALVIQGDSMEPLLHDGSIVFYKQQCEVENGEIAIVDIDGNGVTCKKVYFNYDDNIVLLKSLNEKYDDRELSPERVRIIGKVVL